MNAVNKVAIDASQGVYGLFAAYDYSAWQALAEFIDNSVSSWLSLPKEARQEKCALKITWEPDFGTNGRLTVEDNAGGIGTKDLDRAFKLATPPADLKRLNQFGVGMKVAACWFAREWVVETSALAELMKRTIRWNTNDIVAKNISALPIVTKEARADLHYTRITLTELNHPPEHPLTLKKIKEYLPKVFRRFVEKGWLTITWNDELLKDSVPRTLKAPIHNKPGSKPILWEKQFTIKLRNGMKVPGYARLFDSWAKQQTALNYFWRDRLIQGNIEPFNRPTELFGGGNSFRTGRLYVELEADDFKVTSDKKSIDFGRSDTSEGEILEQLKKVLSDKTVPLLQQGENYRSGKTGQELVPAVEKNLSDVKRIAERNGSRFLSNDDDGDGDDDTVRVKEKIAEQVIEHSDASTKVAFKILCKDAGPREPWVAIKWDDSRRRPMHRVEINIQHAFVQKHLTKGTVPIFIGVAVSIMYGELKARTTLGDEASLVRAFTDQFLRIMASRDDGEIDDSDED